MSADFTAIPKDWFLMRLVNLHSTIAFRGERHEPLHPGWLCELQHVEGGRLTSATANSPNAAVKAAASKTQKGEA